MTNASDRITALLREAAAGDAAAEQDALRLLHAELKRIAARHMRRERQGHTLQPTALVNEAYVRMLRGAEQDWRDRTHFLAVASNVMRRILVDHARRRATIKRHNPDAVLPEIQPGRGHSPEVILAVDEALSRLAASHARQARIVELRFFAGMTDEEVASVLAVSIRTVKRDWRAAKTWLYRQLRG